jgi:uncharacterized protein YPO0396
MSTLFNNNIGEGGYRLRYMEVFNWGTFNEKVYKIQPDCRTSLLTGANASGKTTLVDALLTLLVPRGRFYNQSSGAEIKKDRDELSYFWGFYGKTYSESDDFIKTEQLRNKADNPYCVLLACFQNSATMHTISLVQIRWFSSGALKKVFVVSPYPLNISDHFGKGKFESKGDWKRKLQQQFPKTDIFDNFKDYANRFSELFGLREKALSLFNQTVGIKVLGDLTQFIRLHMLEEPGAEEQFKSLYSNYVDLLNSHKAIQKDEKQIALLEPIIESKYILSELNQKSGALRFIQDQLPFYYDKIESGLLDVDIKGIEDSIGIHEQAAKTVNDSVSQMEEERSQLISQKSLLNIDNQIQLIQKDIQRETSKVTQKHGAWDDYIKLASSLGLQSDVDENSFRENLLAAETLFNSLQGQFDILTEERARLKIDREAASIRMTELQEEITSLLKRKNRIPHELVTLRQRLLDLLDSGEDELPFVGELIKVREDCYHWEDAIERVLHSFAMQLLVPEKFLREVNFFVHANNLQAKLIFQKIERRHADTLVPWPQDHDELVNKIELKKSDYYRKWIERQLLERHNFYCTDDLDVFNGSQRAVTSNGLIRNASRHEKDDRPNNWTKLKYRLGWDNRELVRLLQTEMHELAEKINKSSGKLTQLKDQIEDVDSKKMLVNIFQSKKTYEEIHWQRHSAKIQDLEKQVEDLRRSSDQYKTICEQLDKTEKDLKELRKNLLHHESELKTLKRQYLEKSNRKLNIQFEGLTAQGTSSIDQFVKDHSIAGNPHQSMDELNKFRKVLNICGKESEVQNSKDVKECELRTVTQINEFVNPDGKTLRDFPDWSGDVMNINANLESLNDLEELFKTVRNQRLVEHKRRFREYMDKSMLDALTNFRTWLTNEEDRIAEIVDELNVPLKKITFNRNPDTYLQLNCRPSKEQEIKIFKEKLSAAIPNAIEFARQTDEALGIEVFDKIKELITDLQQEEVWRKKVTDVRNWLIFSAKELSIADGKAIQYHENTASYSGGQKAQFTYAILGAAIAHQFGIFQPGKQHRSFRFITVDEAFSKLDPEKSEFLMQFCDQLNLQLLVVTPLDKINIVERYINAIHFVEIKNRKYSMVYNLTMDEYHERKEEFEQLAIQANDNS